MHWQSGTCLRKTASHKAALLLIGLALLCLAGCAPAGQTQFAAPLPTTAPSLPPADTATPTLLPPTASATPDPTHTPTPSPTRSPTPTPEPVIRMVFTGQIVPARCIQAEIDAAGNADYIYDLVREQLTGADLTIGALNAAVSDIPPMTGCQETFVLVSRAENAYAMARAGFDVMSVATNHIKNCGTATCGDQAFLDTLNNLRLAGVAPVGAGNNLAEAALPVVVEIKGVRFAFVSLGQIEPNAFAGENTPGIAILTEESLTAAIQQAREVADVVIALPHWGPEYSYAPNYLQKGLAEAAVQAGADLVIGNHTHYPQQYEIIDDIPVFYGLGNFIFDQTWSVETRQSLIVEVSFIGKKLGGFGVYPVITDRRGQASYLDAAEADLLREKLWLP